MKYLLILFLLLSGCASQIVEKPKFRATQKLRITFYSKPQPVASTNKYKAIEGYSCAAHISVPFGTQYQIPELAPHVGEWFTVDDRGSAVTSMKASNGKVPVVDVFVRSPRKMEKLARELPEYLTVHKL